MIRNHSGKPFKLRNSLIAAIEHGRLQGYLFLDTNEGMFPIEIDAESAEFLRNELDKFFKHECATMADLDENRPN
jgi:hypothetical protein